MCVFVCLFVCVCVYVLELWTVQQAVTGGSQVLVNSPELSEFVSELCVVVAESQVV